MPDQGGIQPPYLDPSAYPDYLDMQRKQMLAQMLMGNMQQAGQTPSDWDSMRVVPKRSPLQGVTQLASALLAGRAMKGAQKAQTQYFQSLYGEPASSTSSPPAAPVSLQPPPSDPNEQSVQPLIARNGQSFDQAMGGGQAAPAPSNPMIPPGMSRGTASALMGMMGPEKYGESFVAPAFKPAEIRAQIRAAGVDPDSEQGRRMALGAIQKALTNVQDVRPGGTVYDVSSGRPLFNAPNASGIQIGWGPNGPVAGAVPGFQEAEARGAGLETAAKVGNTPQPFPTQGGGSTVGYPGDILGAPPALRGGPPPPAAPVAPASATPTAPKGYFPSTQPVPVPKDPNDLWSGMPKLPVSKALGAPDAFTEGRLKAAGAKDAELSSQYGKESDLADQKLQYNAEARKAIGKAETGPMSEWMTENRAKLLEWGVPESLVPGSDKVTPTMELNKNLKQSALQGARAIFGSRMTQMEVRLQHEELSPSTSMTRDAIQSLMRQDDIKQMYAKQRSEDYGKYIQNGGDPLRFESWYSKTFPLTKFAQEHVGKQSEASLPKVTLAPAAALEHLKQHPELKEAFRQKYGYVP